MELLNNMLSYNITSITPSTPTSPGSISVSGDVTTVAKGKYFLNEQSGEIVQPYNTPPDGYISIQASTFEIIDNPKYNGRYTVYTQKSITDVESSVFINGITKINVREAIQGLTPSDNPSTLTSGKVINFSTYTINVGTVKVIVPPTVIDFKYTVPMIGKNTKAWGELYNQSLFDLLDHSAGTIEPKNPLVGQMWYDTGFGKMRAFGGQNWYTFGNATSARVLQSTASKVWTIKHSLEIPSPFICNVSVFVVRNGVYRTIIPSEISFVDANTIRISFTKNESGAVLIHA